MTDHAKTNHQPAFSLLLALLCLLAATVQSFAQAGSTLRVRLADGFDFPVGKPDAAGELNGGQKFANMADLQKLMLASQDRVARCVTEKLLTFATGRPMGFSDRSEIDRLATESKVKGHAMRDLIHAIVQSEIFQSK